MLAARSLCQVFSLDLSEPLVVAHVRLFLCERYALSQVHAVMSFTDAVLQVIGENADEHFSEILLVQPLPELVPLHDPGADVGCEISDIATLRESVESSQAM